MNVFTDFHHASLLNSLIMLFEGRLGGNVYRPIGMEWHTEGFWAVYDHPATALQFLTTDQGYRPIDGTPPLNLIEEVRTPEFSQSQVYYCRDIDSGQLNKAITLESFKDMPIDIVIASMPEHIEPFKRLIQLYKPNAKLIYQVGNAWNQEYPVDNVMASAIVPLGNVPNSIVYHQEFDLKVFKPGNSWDANSVYSFVNILQETSRWSSFLETERLLPDYKFRSYGGQCRDGAMHGSVELANKMRDAEFIWHVKPGGDGYGHVLFNAAATGKPIITNLADYRGKLGEAVLIPGETCVDVGSMEPSEIRAAIQWFSQPDNYDVMSAKMYETFKATVDFDAEFEKVKEFLACLI